LGILSALPWFRARRPDLIGRTLAHYRITAAIGAGGMGEVYRATDTKLGRDVALKVLPADMARDPERLARFQREARAIAALNHPHIVTIFSVEETDGVHFLTMELVEGQSLERRIPQGGLPVQQIVEIASALADALAAAHEKGIVHRDLKPANVMVTDDGRVKVLDFGLAKDVRADNPSNATLTSAGHTQAGIVMGTPAYMSPEQISGRALDHRTDIFSLGIILYEMATGRRPFEGTSSAELASSILRDTPAAITSGRTDLPADLARVIRRCLEKDPRHRVQTARDVTNEFRDLERQSSQTAAVPASRAVPATPVSGAARADEGFWVAVLPFKYTGANTDLTALAEGLTEDIVTGLSRFSYLRVIARGSTAKYSSESGDVRATGKELGARYVMEGSLRQAGTRLRLAVQLVDTTSGTHLWAETYDRAFNPEAVFELQDELVPRIVSTVAETHGVLPYSMSQTLRNRNPDELTPYEALLRGFAYFKHVNATDHTGARAALEKAVQQAPGNSDCLAMLSMLYREEYNHGFNLRPDPLGRALAAARRAFDAAPSNHLAHHALASVLYFRRELQAFRSAAQRAMELNPMDGFTIAYMGFQISFSGDWERGCALMERARSLNPNHPGWYWFPPFFNAYRQGDYRAALEFALKVNMPGFWRNELALAATYGQLGELEMARTAAQELLAARPEFATVAREECRKWWDPDLVEQIIDGLRKAGLEIAAEGNSAAVATKPEIAFTPDSGAARAAEGFWVAVLPFKYSGNNADLTALVEGLTADIVTGLSRFSYLRVIARGSTAKYSSESGDIRAIGKQLGARYVMEGNLRQAGTKLRLAVQLVEAATGSHLWAETYERSLNPDAVFELQDELVPRIVSTVADRHGVLPHSMSEAVQAKNPEQLTPYEAVLLSFSYAERITADEQIAAKACLERAVAQLPGYADGWAMLAMLFCDEYSLGFKADFSVLERALETARRAVKAGPSNHLAYQNLAYAHFLRREFGPCRSAVERSLALNSMDGSNVWFMGLALSYMGDWERGCALVERAMQLNPNFPGKYHYPLLANAYRKGDYRGALNEALRMNLPDVFYTPLEIAAAAAQLGERETAEKALRDLLKLKPDIAEIVREELGKWFQPELVEHFLEGLRKAGLEIPAAGSAPAVSSFARSAVRTTSGETRADEGFWVAVLPFKYSGTNAELTALVEGLTADIVTGLSRFSYLKVIARGSTAKYSSESGDVRAIGKELGARFVMEGNLRQAGTKLRLAVQLVDATTGAHLWAENYERTFDPETVFALQDELVPRIVSTVADAHGILPHTMSEAIRSKNPEQLTPYEAVLRSFSYAERVSPEEHAAARAGLERAVQLAPTYAYAWALLSMTICDEYAFGFNPQPDPLERALHAARRAVELDSSGHRGYQALALVLFYRREIQAFRTAAEKALALNPMDGCNIAHLGSFIAYAGEWQRGCALVEHALQLNPNHPGWYWFPLCFSAYTKRDYHGALNYALKINLPGLYSAHLVLAAAYGQLGQREEAAKAVQELLTLRPDIAMIIRPGLAMRFDFELVEHLIDGLRKAGLEIPEDPAQPVPAPPAPASATAASGAIRAEEGFWVAVLPFKYAGTSPDLKALADGLSEEVVTGLSRFSYLRVIARGSTAKYSSESGDVRTIGKELGARYVMEGNLRQAGSKLRLAVQLVDATNGAHLWAENFERDFSPEKLFALQDDLVPRIVSTVADMNGVLTRSMSEAVRSRTPEQLSPYEAVLRSFCYSQRATPEELAVARSALELAVQKAPAYGDAWASLAILCVQDYAQGFNLHSDSLASGLTAAQRAVEASPSDYMAYCSLAQALFFHKEYQSFRNAAERAAELNPMDGCSIALLGELVTYTGDSERGLALVGQAKQLNPNHPGWYWYADFYNAYRQRDYRGALRFALKVNLPGHWFQHATVAAACGQLGETDAAAKALKDLLKLRPDFASTVRKDMDKWWKPDYVEHLIDGLRKAGLEITPEKAAATPARASASSSAPAPSAPETASKPHISGTKHRNISLAIMVGLLVIAAAGVVIYLKSTKTSAIDSIAVLPLENRSNDPDSDYISDGITESINNSLARLPSLSVIPYSVASHYKGKAMDVRKIGDELRVQAVLAGSVAQRGDDLTVDVELDDVRNGKQLWGEQYHRKLADLLAVQNDIAREVSQRLRSQLSSADQQRLTKGSTDNPEAYRLYLKGKYYTYKLTKEGFDTGIDYFNQAIAIDPNYALAYSGLAFNYVNQDDWFIPPAEAGPKTKEAAKRALAIDESDVEAHLSMAIVAHWYDWNWATAESEFRRTIELNPNSSDAHLYYGWFLAPMRREDQAVAEVKRSQQIDPLSVFPALSVGAVYVFTRQWDPAMESLRHAIAIDPNFWFSYSFLGRVYEQKGKLPEAIAQFQHALELEKENTEIWSGLGNAYAVSGNKAEAQKVLDHLKELSAHNWVAPYNVAVIYAGLGEKDHAFALLERAYQDRSYYMPTFLSTDERLDNLRSDPRFADLKRRVGLP
jgi:adenylate cyclase